MDLSNRITKLNDAPENSRGRYVLYWMQMFKRASNNYALNFAIKMANARNLPLVVYEGLRFDYPWANDRIHRFILDRPWFAREIFGTIRYMSSTSMAKKFRAKTYIEWTKQMSDEL